MLLRNRCPHHATQQPLLRRGANEQVTRGLGLEQDCVALWDQTCTVEASKAASTAWPGTLQW